MQIRYARLRISKLYYNPRGRGILPIGMVQLFLKKTEFPHNIILGSFTWRKSEKGNDFWSNLFEKARLI